MSDQQGTEPHIPDFDKLSENMSAVAEKSQRLIADFMKRQAEGDASAFDDPLNIGHTFLELTQKMMADPAKVVNAQMGLWQDYLKLWQHAAEKMTGAESDPVAKPAAGDKRFRHDDWEENQVFDFMKQSYLLTADWMKRTVHEVDGLDDHTHQKVDFYTSQFADALSPTNFAAMNPQVLHATIDSGGENLVKGLDNLLRDLEKGDGKLAVSMTDQDAFDVGRNIATTPGKVIYQNDLIQLLQYSPTTDEVNIRPLLIIPPWINKFYVLDLQPKNSFIKWAVEQGQTVFVISWVNPDDKLAAKSFEDYMLEGPLAALDAIEAATGEAQVNAIGYCIGGTLLASTMSYMVEKKDKRIKSATFFTALVDFAEVGDLAVFVDDEQIDAMEKNMAEKGYLEGREMATTFNMLRSNDLIWSFVVNNYLLGKDPFPFDLLYWNSDSTRMPAAMHTYYLRNMYQKNLLSTPGGVTLDGVPIDLGKVKTPVYILATKEDHIAPWKSSYKGSQLYSGKNKFVLSGSGHIAGVVNPPAANKYGYWTNPKLPEEADDWFAGAKQHDGSWWPDWIKWIKAHDKTTVPARTPGDGKLEVLEDAPGSFVQVKA
jgi:polyhydroxyalkanoate synthase subunit PhaC